MASNSWLMESACGLALLAAVSASAAAEVAKPSYAAMAPLAQYKMASAAEEIALARSAAPPSVSGKADVLVLGDQGYETVVKGDNGFACLVERSWGAGFDDEEFWNPKTRGPICFNPVAVRTVVPIYLERTRWVLAGVSRQDMIDRSKAELAAGTLVRPGPGAMCYMMSKQGRLNDADGHWHPHLMFFVADTGAASWGANLKGSPVFAAPGDPGVTIFMVPVTHWSDGTPAMMMKMH
jgi:hypothetical protein